MVDENKPLQYQLAYWKRLRAEHQDKEQTYLCLQEGKHKFKKPDKDNGFLHRECRCCGYIEVHTNKNTWAPLDACWSFEDYAHKERFAMAFNLKIEEIKCLDDSYIEELFGKALSEE